MPDESKWEKKDRFDALLKLAESFWKQMDTRRAYEWKVSFGLWTALGVLAGLLIRGEFSPELRQAVFYAVSLGGIVLVYIFWWSAGLHKRHAENKQAANHFWGLAAVELGLEPDSIKQFTVRPIPPIIKDWSHFSQISFTVLLAFIAGIALFIGRKETKDTDRTRDSDNACCCVKCCAPPVLPQNEPKQPPKSR